MSPQKPVPLEKLSLAFHKSKQAEQIRAMIPACHPLSLQEWRNSHNPAEITHSSVTDIQLKKLNTHLPTGACPDTLLTKSC